MGADWRKSVSLKLVIDRDRPLEELRALAARVANPYQIIVPEGKVNIDRLKKNLETLTSANPYTPFEVVMIEPARRPSPCDLLDNVHLHRPHFLDVEFRFMLPKPGNRAVLFTLVTTDNRKWHQGGMERQLFLWKGPGLPDEEAMEGLESWDGILIDSDVSSEKIEQWQQKHGPDALDSLPPIGFSNLSLQEEWLKLIKDDEYYFGARQVSPEG